MYLFFHNVINSVEIVILMDKIMGAHTSLFSAGHCSYTLFYKKINNYNYLETESGKRLKGRLKTERKKQKKKRTLNK